MSEANRRTILAVTGTGAAAGAVALTAGPAAARGPAPSRNAARESVVAYVEDHHSDEVVLLVGERELIVRDRALVTAILDAAGGA